MQQRGDFRFDIAVLVRTDGVAAVARTDQAGIVDEIRVGRVRTPSAETIWTRTAQGRWSARQAGPEDGMVNIERLDENGKALVQKLAGPLFGQGPSGPGKSPQPDRSKVNKLQSKPTDEAR
jgi:hypothetical protein